jgi:L-lysine exporter family protein LysE/ArgO
MITTAPITNSIYPLSQGFLLCVSLIIAIGPQNLFILRQGLRRQHLFAIVLFSTLADLFLISLGVSGLSALISTNGIIQMVATVGGVIFLLGYGVRSLIRAYHPSSLTENATPHNSASGVHTAIIAALSFAFLNPAKYLDTLILIGTKSLVFPVDQRLIFGIGAVLASTFWFFTLAYGSSKLSRIFQSQLAWRTLDIISGCIMLCLAGTMIAASHIAL